MRRRIRWRKWEAVSSSERIGMQRCCDAWPLGVLSAATAKLITAFGNIWKTGCDRRHGLLTSSHLTPRKSDLMILGGDISMSNSAEVTNPASTIPHYGAQAQPPRPTHLIGFPFARGAS